MSGITPKKIELVAGMSVVLGLVAFDARGQIVRLAGRPEFQAGNSCVVLVPHGDEAIAVASQPGCAIVSAKVEANLDGEIKDHVEAWEITVRASPRAEVYGTERELDFDETAKLGAPPAEDERVDEGDEADGGESETEARERQQSEQLELERAKAEEGTRRAEKYAGSTGDSQAEAEAREAAGGSLSGQSPSEVKAISDAEAEVSEEGADPIGASEPGDVPDAPTASTESVN